MVLDVRRKAIRVFCLVLVLQVASTSNLICPINCRCEPELNKVNCSAANVDDSTLREISERTENLDLSRNDFTQLPETLFTYFENIVVLDVSSNKLSTIHRYAFARMDGLRHLDLSNNRIRSLSDISAFISSLARLQILNISANHLVNLGETEHQILYSDSLLHLDASRCQIGHVHGTFIFQGLPKLEVLDLSRNPLTRIEGFFSDTLRSLDVSHSQLKFLHADTLDNLGQLRELRIGNNQRLSDQYARLSSASLAYLDASYCSIDSNYASELVEAHTVILRGNHIRAIARNAFENNSKLETLDLSANRIGFVDEFAFNGADSLRYLDLSENSISTLAANTFAFSRRLVHLNLSTNSLHSLDAIQAPSVRFLDVSFCRIRTIVGNALSQTPFIQVLNVSYNFVEKLPENFTSKSLQILNAAFCRLASVSATNVHQLPALRELDLQGNRLVYVKNTTFQSCADLRLVNLANNPWKCDCLDVNFHTLWKSLQPYLANKSTLICQYPENVTGWKWEDACSAPWFHGSAKRKDVVVLLIIVTILFVSGVVACVIALRENWVTHRNRTSPSVADELDHAGSVHEPGDSANNAESAAVAESIRKLTQLPTYDEALLLPRLSLCDQLQMTSRSAKVKKRQSATQTDETMLALLPQTEPEPTTESAIEELTESPKVRRVPASDDASEEATENQGAREQIEPVNAAPLPIQCTEL